MEEPKPVTPKVEIPPAATPVPAPAPVPPIVADPAPQSMEVPKAPVVPSVPDAKPAAPQAEVAPLITPMPPAPTPNEEFARSLNEPNVPAAPAAPAPVPAAPAAPAPAPVAPPPADAFVAPQPAAPAGEKVAPAPAPKNDSLLLSIKFISTETDLPLAVEDDLKKVAARIKANNERISLVAYASESADQATMARRVSLSRVLAVRAFLIEQGVDKLRMNVQAEGSKNDGGEPNRVDILLSGK